MEEKNLYVAPNIDISLYSMDDVVRTSEIGREVGGGWDSEGWGEKQ